MSRNKVGMEVRRRLLTQKYNLNRETPLGEIESRWASRWLLRDLHRLKRRSPEVRQCWAIAQPGSPIATAIA